MASDFAKPPPADLFELIVDQWTKPFWDSAKERRLVAPRCRSCGRFRMPPTPFCPACLSQEIDWPEISGRGVIYSFTIVSRAVMPGTEESIPYVPALVELPDAGGVRLITNIVDAPLNAIRIGSPVMVAWREREAGPCIPFFALA